jgi:hypothetical protein
LGGGGAVEEVEEAVLRGMRDRFWFAVVLGAVLDICVSLLLRGCETSRGSVESGI